MRSFHGVERIWARPWSIGKILNCGHGESTGRENSCLLVWNKPILFLFQVQVLKLLLNLSENPAMTEGLLGAQVNSLHICFVNKYTNI